MYDVPLHHIIWVVKSRLDDLKFNISFTTLYGLLRDG